MPCPKKTGHQWSPGARLPAAEATWMGAGSDCDVFLELHGPPTGLGVGELVGVST